MSKKQFMFSVMTILFLPILLLLLMALFSGCDSKKGTAPATAETIDPTDEQRYRFGGEFKQLSTIGGGSDVYRYRYQSNGMTYEAVYVKMFGTGGTVSIDMQVVNLTKDSLEVFHLSPNK